MGINQPKWKTPEYSKRQIKNAGDVIRYSDISDEQQKKALLIIDNWRAAHAYPLHVFYVNLRNRASNKPGILVVERLKRLDSIISKLQREPKMELTRMHDLGGCRVVLPNIEEVYSFSNSLKSSKIRHEFKRTYDYIQRPKTSGYRSLHHVYRFYTESDTKKVFNEYPMLVEIQFRTHLQHIWATAVESIGLFTNQALKAGLGDEAVKRFFVIVSSLFAIKEGCPVVEGTSDNQKDLICEIKSINKEHHILEMLRAIRTAVKVEVGKDNDKRGYYILQLNYNEHRLRMAFFMPGEAELANNTYDVLEEKYKNDQIDIVLVRAASLGTVKAAYPNYFLDIGEFVSLVEGYLLE